VITSVYEVSELAEEYQQLPEETSEAREA